MDVKAFVSATLTQILDGIREAQKKPGGDDIVADGHVASQGNVIQGGRSGFFTHVEFDISIVAETKDGGNIVRVADASITDGSSTTAHNASRVKFAVLMRLPKGGENRDPPQDWSGGSSYRSDF